MSNDVIMNNPLSETRQFFAKLKKKSLQKNSNQYFFQHRSAFLIPFVSRCKLIWYKNRFQQFHDTIQNFIFLGQAPIQLSLHSCSTVISSLYKAMEVRPLPNETDLSWVATCCLHVVFKESKCLTKPLVSLRQVYTQIWLIWYKKWKGTKEVNFTKHQSVTKIRHIRQNTSGVKENSKWVAIPLRGHL